MNRPPLGLARLAEAVHERCRRPWRHFLWVEMRRLGVGRNDLEYADLETGEQASDALADVQAGDFAAAARRADDLWIIVTPWDGEECEHWRPFQELCHLLDRCDALLTTLEADAGAAPLARGCRDDVDALPILADWCDDQRRPAAAAELRHLRERLRELQS